ncbi:MAG: hypothetical protein AAF914_01200 [Pseudomonadota bacterium]
MALTHFIKDEAGAVTVDFVVLTAGIVGFGLAAVAVVIVGLEGASNETSTEIAAMDAGGNFFTSLNGVDWSGYLPVASTHGASWGNGGLDAEGRTWAENTYDGWSQLGDGELVAMYNEQYAIAITGNTGSEFHRQRADYISVTEQILTERGIDTPDGNLTAEEIRALYN